MIHSPKMIAAAALAIVAAGFLLWAARRGRQVPAMSTASTIGQASPSGRVETATFAAGCFWGVETMFRQVEGVLRTAVGYTGGHADRPTYQQVCSDRTGHAEAVRVEYDPAKVSYERLLEVFFGGHDPTTPNRQGPDFGSQYRSAIFYHDARQRELAEQAKAALERSARLGRPVVTEIVPAQTFWPAEDYHQQYHEKRGGGSCGVR